MKKVKLMIDDKVVFEYVEPQNTETYGKKVFDGFDANRNVKEYDGIVATIQKWYYDGYLSKTQWCASSMSYFCHLAGCLDNIGGKNDNVCAMMKACERAGKEGKGTFLKGSDIPATIPKYAILFWLWEGQMSEDNPKKHVGMAEYAASGNTIYCIGGNQSDKICTKAYDRKYLYAIYVLP